MSRVVLITDIDTALGHELVRRYVEGGDRVLATSSDEETRSSFNDVAGDSLTVVRWNRRSPVSARNMVLKTLAVFDELDEVLLLGPPEPGKATLLQVDYAEIEEEIDTWVKGTLFLAREILGYFEKRRRGVAALIGQNLDGVGSPLGEGVRAAFAGITRALLAEYARRDVVVNGFESPGSQAEDYAAFIMKSLDDKARKVKGRWFRYQSGLLSGFRSGRS